MVGHLRVILPERDGLARAGGGRWPWATVFELAWKESAFVALVVVATVGRRYDDLREVAAVLGASLRERSGDGSCCPCRHRPSRRPR